MKTAHPAPHPLGREPTRVFADPWNEPLSMAVKVRTTIAFVLFMALVVLFASTASGWVASMGPEPARPTANAPKSNRAERSPVPVLAPSGMSAAQAEEFAERLRVTPDGYFSRVSYEAYDVVIDGSVRGGSADSAIRISETERGLALTFGRSDGAYQIEFVCRGPGSEEGVRCLSEADAAEFAATIRPFGE